jgi:bifunctional UDP-N-acetylglucosamine pyrophosphorylase/glucosamine-1-phosphate N-acetyltransferase
MRAFVHTTGEAAPDLLDGVSRAELLRATLEELGLPIAPALPGIPFLWWDANYPLIQPERLHRLIASGGGVLRDREGAVAAVLHDGRPVSELPATALDEEESLRVSDPWNRARASKVLEQRRIAAFMRQGVHFVDPARVFVERTVAIQPGARIWPDVVLRGSTDLSRDCEIQSGAWLVDTRVGARSVVKPYTICESASIDEDCAVGPMAHLRPGAVLDREVKVGNFVEVKNTHLREGAKASHLTYLGDAHVGREANVGAGTITCNYDGFGKHRTIIGDRAFIGSNSALVAPVAIGDGAIVGAGSVITRDVPGDAIAVERAELRVLEGRAPALNDRNRERAAARKRTG